ncbi:hypothetical protein CDO52_16045 [Nocardiopsis gilva YIM 90087]|uniref:NodB homology domain-containing protein n=2 Tax=Nocardiopsis gilva TaxID=280236 RepID=A0A223S7J3_9ACTN|nr:polysaccharide deacetylase family protein [Nocardiopsis gilva]ASU84097.1 hypothetical protein CDO52_16045 [Nocardiopsis gilva YIM 90087]
MTTRLWGMSALFVALVSALAACTPPSSAQPSPTAAPRNIDDADFFRRLRDETGAQIENHTLDHPDLTSQSATEQRRQTRDLRHL